MRSNTIYFRIIYLKCVNCLIQQRYKYMYDNASLKIIELEDQLEQNKEVSDLKINKIFEEKILLIQEIENLKVNYIIFLSEGLLSKNFKIT